MLMNHLYPCTPQATVKCPPCIPLPGIYVRNVTICEFEVPSCYSLSDTSFFYNYTNETLKRAYRTSLFTSMNNNYKNKKIKNKKIFLISRYKREIYVDKIKSKRAPLLENNDVELK